MNYCRCQLDRKTFWAVEEGEQVAELSRAPWQGGERTGKTFPRSEVRLLAPVAPSKIVCVGRNYRAHAKELGNQPPREPLIFLKPPSAIIGPDEAIVYPPQSERVDYEGELALVIGRRCRNLKPSDDPLSFVFGFTCLNDVTARDLQKADGSFTRGKGFDTFCPVGPMVATGLDPAHLILETYVNGQRRQRGQVSEMIFSLDAIMRFISGVMTLEPGDLIATGTPAGVAPLSVGDTVEVAIEGIGRLRNKVTPPQK